MILTGNNKNVVLVKWYLYKKKQLKTKITLITHIKTII